MKSSVPRLIQPPGYHIRSKYDLQGLRERQLHPHKSQLDFGLSLVAMIDMFSTLVIFLLLNFSATGEAYFVSKNVVIPKAVNVRNLEAAPLVSITRDRLVIDSAAKNKTSVLLSGLEASMPSIVAALQKIKQQQADLVEAGIAQKNQINLQADEGAQVGQIKQIMNILIQQGFGAINFAVRETSPDEI